MSVLEVVDLSYDSDGHSILKTMGFSLSSSDHAGVIGPNGAGKSTLLKLLAGLIKPSSGRILFNNRNLLSLTHRERSRIVAYLPQSSSQSQLKGLSVHDLVLTGRYAYKDLFSGYSKRDFELTRSALEQMGLLSLKDRDVSTLSGGEFQKVLLAGVIAQDAEIILLDEAFSFLDVRYRLEMETLLCGLLKREKIVISVFHHIDESLYTKNRIIALKKGTLFFNGRLDEFIRGRDAERLYGIPFKKLPLGKKKLLWPVMRT
jgi:iron complex transport system ATP-binding protein